MTFTSRMHFIREINDDHIQIVEPGVRRNHRQGLSVLVDVVDSPHDIYDHLERIELANLSYSLKRGLTASIDHSNVSPFNKLIAHLYTSVKLIKKENRNVLVGHCSDFFSILSQIDMVCCTLNRIINDRCSLLWRNNKGPTSLEYVCCLHQDVWVTMAAFAFSIQELFNMIYLNSTISATKSNSYLWMIIKQISGHQKYVFPSILMRIEKHVEIRVHESAMAQYQRIFCSDSLIENGSFLNRRKSRRNSGETVISVAINSNNGLVNSHKNETLESIILNLVFGIVNEWVIIVSEKCETYSSVMILSSLFNSILDSILIYISFQKLRISRIGLANLQAIFVQIQNKVIYVRDELIRKNSNSSISDATFQLIQDKTPWIRVNCILQVLQTVSGRKGSKTTLLERRMSGGLGGEKIVGDRERQVDVSEVGAIPEPNDCASSMPSTAFLVNPSIQRSRSMTENFVEILKYLNPRRGSLPTNSGLSISVTSRLAKNKTTRSLPVITHRARASSNGIQADKALSDISMLHVLRQSSFRQSSNHSLDKEKEQLMDDHNYHDWNIHTARLVNRDIIYYVKHKMLTIVLHKLNIVHNMQVVVSVSSTERGKDKDENGCSNHNNNSNSNSNINRQATNQNNDNNEDPRINKYCLSKKEFELWSSLALTNQEFKRRFSDMGYGSCLGFLLTNKSTSLSPCIDPKNNIGNNVETDFTKLIRIDINNL